MNTLSAITNLLLALASTRLVLAHDQNGHSHGQVPLDDLRRTRYGEDPLWKDKYGEVGDQTFSGLLSFSHLPYTACLMNETASFDIGILGMPFDTGVSYRTGARFGPYAIRSGSRPQLESWGYTVAWNSSPYELTNVLDCGDVPVNPFDNALALDQMEIAYHTLLRRTPTNKDPSKDITKQFAKDGQAHPRIVSLGGDHTIVLPVLRALNKVYGPVAVIHFDAHLDTWTTLSDGPGGPTDPKQYLTNHGTFFYVAYNEGLIANNSIHAGLRCKMTGVEDLNNDAEVGFQFVTSDDIDTHGPDAIIERIRTRVGDSPVYLSLDIDVVDPGMAPGTGTPEAGGWSTREVKRILRGLSGLNFVGVDVVEVSPPFDHSEVTGIAAANIVHDFLEMMVNTKPPTGFPHWPSSARHDEL
ncbi:Arginase/deacetylase [Daedaleopsis nitida]|nr:Arginase/deacetylase [Daedaleopsis nitida]